MIINMKDETNVNTHYDTVKRKDTIIKIDSSDKHANWFNFMKVHYTKKWEQETFDILDRFANNNKVLIDIGSWVGPISLYYANKYRYIYSIEADKESVKILKRNIELNNFNNIIVIEKAIYNKNENIYFGPNEFRLSKEMNISVSQNRELKLYNCDYKVEGITFKEILKKYQIDNVNIGMIKCDIEGGEENIINDILAHGYNYHIPIWMSFHVKWWKKHKLEDFSNIFDLFYDSNIFIEDIKKNPSKSVLFFKVTL